jgi:hypothetical protein
MAAAKADVDAAVAGKAAVAAGVLRVLHSNLKLKTRLIWSKSGEQLTNGRLKASATA